MATPAWQVSGQYYETCSCDFVCPCILGQMAVTPTKGSCTFAMAFQVDRGSYGDVSLDGLGFIVLGLTPEAMGKGNWSVGRHRRRAGQRRAARCDHRDRERRRRRSDVRAVGSGRHVPGRRIGADPLRSQRRQMVRQGGGVSSTWPPKVPWASIRTRPSRFISTTPAIRRRIASRWPTPRRATCTRSAWRGTTRAERTTDSTRRFPGGVRSPSAGRGRSPAATASSSRPASLSSPRSPGRISSISIARCRRRWSTTR